MRTALLEFDLSCVAQKGMQTCMPDSVHASAFASAQLTSASSTMCYHEFNHSIEFSKITLSMTPMTALMRIDRLVQPHCA